MPRSKRTLIILALALAALTLSACSGHPKPEPMPRIIEVPVPVPCSPDPALLPERDKRYTFSTVTPDDTHYDKTRAIILERIERATTIDQLWAALDGCTNLPAPPPPVPPPPP